MILLFILGTLSSLVYAIVRATRKWGIRVLYFPAAGIVFPDASGVLSERLFGPSWSWNFASHGVDHAFRSLAQGTRWLTLGFTFAASPPGLNHSTQT